MLRSWQSSRHENRKSAQSNPGEEKKEDNNYSNDAILIEPDYNSINLTKEQE
jgi:hypothetical protein